MPLPDPGPTELSVAPLAQLRLRRSAKWQTHPVDVLPLTVAEMDLALAPAIAGALHEAVDRSDTGYAMPEPGLGQALSGFAARRWGWDVDPASVIAVPDVGVGVVESLRMLTAPGQQVVISPPVYPPFFDWVPEAGRRLVEVPLLPQTGGGWRLDLAGLDHAFSNGPGAYVLCNPHNPVGTVHTPDELAALVRLAERHGTVLISDEIHAPVTLPGATFTPLLSIPGAAAVAISVLSASKAWNLAGLKCAAVVTGSATTGDVLSRLPPDIRWRAGHLGVIAAVAAYTDGDAWLDQLLVTLDRRRAQLGALIAERLPAVAWHPPAATYLAWLDCTAVGPGAAARDRFLDRGRIALEPGVRFGAAGDGFARLNFATSAEILDLATAGMAAALA